MGNANQLWDGYYSGDWTFAGNWNPGDAVPTAVAQFGNTIYTHQFYPVYSGTVLIPTIQFLAGADPYQFNIVGPYNTFAVGGGGLGITGDASSQIFTVSGSATMNFQGGTAANAVLHVNSTGTLDFFNTPANTTDAGSSKITVANQATLNFLNSSDSKTATINSSGSVLFWSQSTADSATINVISNNMIFYNQSNAGNANAHITISSGAKGFFYDDSSAGSANLTVNTGGALTFSWGTTAASSTLDIKSGGVINMVGNSTGGSASVTVETGGTLDASGHTFGNVYFGSISGGGTIKNGTDTKVLVGAPPPASTSTPGGHASAAPLPFTGTIVGSGEFGVNYGTLVFAGNNQSTTNMFTMNGTLELASGAQLAGQLAYEGLSWGSPTLQFDTASLLKTQINGIARSDAVDLRTHAYSATDPTVWTQNANNSGGTLTIGTGASQVVLNVGGVHTLSEFKLVSDGAGGTLITDLGTSQTVSQGLADIGSNASYGRIDFLDSAANVLANMNGLQAMAPNIASITFTDTTPQTFNLTAAQSVADHGALSMVASALTVNVTATAAGFNKLEGGSGNDTLTGAASALNTALFSGASQEYKIATSGSSMTVADGFAHRDGTDTLVNIQRAQFSNVVLAFDVNGDAGQAYRMYQAAFARTPDQAGVSYWVSQVDHGLSLTNMAQNFINSAEFQSIYGASPTASAIVSGLYTNVLGRAPDASGLSYWLGVLQSGTSEANLLVSFSESAENQAHVNPGLTGGIALTSSFFS